MLTAFFLFLYVTSSNALSSPLSGDDQAAIVALHNEWRSNTALGKITAYKEAGKEQTYHPTASDMLEVVWDDALAKVAQTQVDKCVFSHMDDTERRETMQKAKNDGLGKFEYKYTEPYNIYTVAEQIGENLAWTSETDPSIDTLKESVNGWMAEHKNYKFGTVYKTGDYCLADDTKKSTDACGHYLQAVWAKTQYVGCGYKACTDGTYMICTYYVGGNLPSTTVYQQGTPCSACPTEDQKTKCTKYGKGLCTTSTTSTDTGTATGTDTGTSTGTDTGTATDTSTKTDTGTATDTNTGTTSKYSFDDGKCQIGDAAATDCTYTNWEYNSATAYFKSCTKTDTTAAETWVKNVYSAFNSWNIKPVITLTTDASLPSYTKISVAIKLNMVMAQYTTASNADVNGKFSSGWQEEFKNAFTCTSTGSGVPYAHEAREYEPKQYEPKPYEQKQYEPRPYVAPYESPYQAPYKSPYVAPNTVPLPSSGNMWMQELLVFGLCLVVYNIGCCYIIGNKERFKGIESFDKLNPYIHKNKVLYV